MTAMHSVIEKVPLTRVINYHGQQLEWKPKCEARKLRYASHPALCISFPTVVRVLCSRPEITFARERYRKFLKNKCLYNHFYDDFESFRNTIDDCLANSSKKYRDELKTFMALKFQSFQYVQFLVGSRDDIENLRLL